MEKQNINISFYYLLALGLSLPSIIIKTIVPISVPDITILLLLFYAIIIHQRVILNLMILFVLLFALDIFIANIINYYTQTDFSLNGFLRNYIRIIAIVLLIIFIPSLTKELNLNKLCKAILFFIRIHCIIVIFDPVITYPWAFTNDEFSFSWNPSSDGLPDERGRGLFGEPAFFAAYVGLMFSLILQYQANSKEAIYGYWDILIIFLGLIASASLTGMSVAALILLQVLLSQRRDIFKINSVFKSIGVFALAIPILTLLLAGSATFLLGRLAGGLEGGSTLGRVVGSSIYTADILRERPLIGIGLGGENHQLFVDKSDVTFTLEAIETDEEGGLVIVKPATTYWAALVGAGGLPAFFIFYLLILGSLILDKRTFYVGMMIFFLGISKGGVFDIDLWWVISASIALRFVSETDRRTLTKVEEL